MFYLLSFFCFITVFLLIGVGNPIYCIFSLVLLFLCVALITLLLGVEFLPLVFVIVYVGAVAVLFLFVVIILDIKLYRGSYWIWVYPLPLVTIVYISHIVIEHSIDDALINYNDASQNVPVLETSTIEISITGSSSYGKSSALDSFSRLSIAWHCRSVFYTLVSLYNASMEKTICAFYGQDFFSQYYNTVSSESAAVSSSILNWIWQVDQISNIQVLGFSLYQHNYIYLLIAGLILLVAILGAIVLTLESHPNRQRVFKQTSRQPIIGLLRPLTLNFID